MSIVFDIPLPLVQLPPNEIRRVLSQTRRVVADFVPSPPGQRWPAGAEITEAEVRSAIDDFASLLVRAASLVDESGRLPGVTPLSPRQFVKMLRFPHMWQPSQGPLSWGLGALASGQIAAPDQVNAELGGGRRPEDHLTGWPFSGRIGDSVLFSLSTVAAFVGVRRPSGDHSHVRIAVAYCLANFMSTSRLILAGNVTAERTITLANTNLATNATAGEGLHAAFQHAFANQRMAFGEEPFFLPSQFCRQSSLLEVREEYSFRSSRENALALVLVNRSTPSPDRPVGPQAGGPGVDSSAEMPASEIAEPHGDSRRLADALIDARKGR